MRDAIRVPVMDGRERYHLNSNGVLTAKDPGAHDWPGTSGNMDIEANNEIWQFLSKFDKNGMINNLNIEDFHKSVLVTPNPFNNFFKVKGVENDLIELYDLFGRKIECKINDDIFNTENLKRGVYFLIIKEKNISFKLVKS